MGTVERLFSLVLATLMVVYGIAYYQEYRYDLGRWIVGGMLFMSVICMLGCILDWYEVYASEQSLKALYPESAKRRR
jgi:hypothetical protein